MGRCGPLFSNQPPVVGNAAFAFEGTGFPNSALSLLVLGTNPAWMGVQLASLPPGCMQHTDVVTILVGCAGGRLRRRSDRDHGHASDGTAAFAVSNALRVTVY